MEIKKQPPKPTTSKSESYKEFEIKLKEYLYQKKVSENLRKSKFKIYLK